MSYVGTPPTPIPVERQISGVNIGTVVQFLLGKSPIGYVKCGEKFSKEFYPELFNYLGTDVVPPVAHDMPLASLVWFPTRESVSGDFIPADGQILHRNDYNDFVIDYLIPHKVKVSTEEYWQATPLARSQWSVGDGSTTFRMPDLNGVQPDSMSSVFIRGDGKNSGGPGVIQGDAIRNITGHAVPKNTSGMWSLVGDQAGVFAALTESAPVVNPAGETVTGEGGISFDASRVVPTAPENRPVNTAGVWAFRMKATTEFAMKAAGLVENEGMVKIAGLVETDSNLQKQIDALMPETGSNENGRWVKFPDGRLECTKFFPSLPSGMTQTNYTPGLFRYDFAWTFPHPFVGETPITSGDFRDNQASGFFGGSVVDITHSNMVYITPTQDLTNATGVIKAVGRWR